MTTMKNNYAGVIELPDGRKLKFSIKGTSKMEAHNLLRHAQPKAKIKLLRK